MGTNKLRKHSRNRKVGQPATVEVLPAKSASHAATFRKVVEMIDAARAQALHTVNTGLIDLYWRVGAFISRRIADDGWGQNTVVALSAFIRRNQPGTRGFSAQNLWRMRQFYETWRGAKKLSPLVRELSWTHNLIIIGQCRRAEEREFYLRLCQREHWSKRQLERQIDSALFERVVLSPAKLSAPLRELRARGKLAPLVRALSWTHNLIIMSRCKRVEEGEFYLRICQRKSGVNGNCHGSLTEHFSNGRFSRPQNCHQR